MIVEIDANGRSPEHPPPGEVGDPLMEFVRQSWSADAAELGPIREAVRRWMAPLTMSMQARDDIVYAVSEAVSNVVEHAYSDPGRDPAAGTPPEARVELTLWTEPDALCIEVVDDGTWRRPGADSSGRGMGIPMIHRTVESVLIHYDPRGTRMLLRHGLPGEARPAPDPSEPLAAGDLNYAEPDDAGGAGAH